MSSHYTMQALLANAEFHRAKLAETEAQIRSFEPQHALSMLEMQECIAKMEKKNTKAWKKALDDGLIENVQHILNECYDSLRDTEDEGCPAAKVSDIGKLGSMKWQLFMLRVICYLKESGSFLREDGTFDTFEDTSGGCDEVTWDAACYLVENPDWKPAA